MSVNRDGIHIRWGLIKGKEFRRKNGKVRFVAESMSVDDSYEQHYNFVNVFYKLRNQNTGKALTVPEPEFHYHWVEVIDAHA